MKLKLRAGTPNDANREYLPEAIKGSDMVVNENGNNSQPYPQRLVECTGVLVDGVEDRWYEYVPASYDGSKKVPLIVGNHGGLMTGWGGSGERLDAVFGAFAWLCPDMQLMLF